MSEASADPAAIGPFTVKRKLGEGAMGVVYEGFDDKLERKVALKLVRRQLLNNPAVRERMTREAQAMARLSNPNVVQVYQVGEHDGGIYVAMEYVEGETFATWLSSAKRPWQLILRTLCDAGRGLAAAHAAGLVHRDFKPDNVLVDDSGRARVLDFGLVHAEGAPNDPVGAGDAIAGHADGELLATTGGERSPHATTTTPPDGVMRSNVLHWSVRLTQLGNVLGTPAYMSPEQHFGAPAGAAADQFSFAVTLYEALFGVRPFNGDSWAAIRLQVQNGAVPPPPLESTVPRRLFKVLVRALATEPNARWPSLDALIGALERDPWRIPLRVAGMASLIAAASAVSYSLAAAQVEGGQRCQGEVGQISGVWDPAREAAVARAFDATHLPFATDTIRGVKTRIDTYTQAWLDERRAACEDHGAGVQTGHLMDLRIACLDRRKARLAALVDVFAAADGDVVANAVQAAAALPSLRMCSDSSELLAVTQPDDPEVAERVTALQRQIEHADVLESTGRYEEGLKIASAVRGEASSLGYAPLKAEAALSEGRLKLAWIGGAEAEAALADGVRVGIENDLHGVAAEAAILRLYVVGNDLGKPSEALGSAVFAEALVGRARGDERLAALLHNNLGTIHDDPGGDVELARHHYEKALEVLRRRGASDPLEAIVHYNFGIMYVNHGRLDAARPQFARAQALFTSILGKEHPFGAHPLIGFGDVALRSGAFAEAPPYYLEAIALVESSHGREHRYLVDPLSGLGTAYLRTGNAAEAQKHYSRAVQIADKLGVRTATVAEALEGLGDIAADAGSGPQARQLYERASETFDVAVGKDSEKGARATLRAGELAASLGDRDGAIRRFEHVLSKKPGTDPGDVSRAHASLRLAMALAERGEGAERVCALLEAGRAAVPGADPRRVETNNLFARSCAAP